MSSCCESIAFSFFFFFGYGPEDDFESSFSQPENKCKDVNNLQILTIQLTFFMINLRLLSLKAKKILQ